MPPHDLQSRLDLALRAARAAGDLILEHYQSAGLTVDRKRDSSPVTIADRNAEKLIRAEIAGEFPDDSILGEEFGEQPGRSGYRWIIDPLDGTKSFIHGVPLFGTLVGVEFEGRCVVGVCHFPVLRETAWGATGLGAWWQPAGGEPRPARVSPVAELSQALVCFTTVQGFARIGRTDAFESLAGAAGIVRGWGDCYGHILVATGRAEVMVDPLMNPWDAAALVPIVEEAGGSFMDWAGVTTIYSGNGISVNAALRESVLRITRR
ncbi:MAG: histidinol-phosphatase [Planctomycetaceae bacterium]|nr:histidinol-phosphatase [Planctomycetaceae bacterium]